MSIKTIWDKPKRGVECSKCNHVSPTMTEHREHFGTHFAKDDSDE